MYPFIWLGRLLRERGHRVTLVTAGRYEVVAVNAGLAFQGAGDDELEKMLAYPKLWTVKDGSRVGYVHAGRSTGAIAAAVEELIAREGPPDLMMAPMINFGARLIREKRRIPLVSVHLYPMMLPSAHDVPLFAPTARWLRKMPLWVRRGAMTLPNKPLDRHALSAVRESCAAHGVPKVFALSGQWWHSPDGVLALFPEWFAAPKPDWPHHCLQWDFPLEDMSAEQPLEPELQRFLDSGEKPVAFTAGTGQHHAGAFFGAAAEMARQCGCRAVFLTAKPDHLPPDLPDTIFTTTYAPFGELLPRVRALVHHGGIGTMSQCLAAGVPQLIAAMGLDQPDNAERLERLGAGLRTSAEDFIAGRALPLLQRCLHDEDIRTKAAACADRLRKRPSTDALVDWIESRRLPVHSHPPRPRATGNSGTPPVYLIPGLGADSRTFRGPWAEIPGSVFPEWAEYQGEASIPAVARLVAEAWHIPDGAILIATSFGGAVACEIAKIRRLRAVFLIASGTGWEDFLTARRMRFLTRLLPVRRIQRLCREFEGVRRTRFEENASPFRHAVLDSIDMFGVCQASFYRDMFHALSRWEGRQNVGTRLVRIHGRRDSQVRCPADADLALDGGHLVVFTHARECVDFIQAELKSLSGTDEHP